MSRISSLRRGQAAALALMLAGAAGCVQTRSGDLSASGADHSVIPFPVPAFRRSVHFEWDSAALSDRSRQNLENVARVFAQVPNAYLELTAHADTSGGSAHNQRLSEWRMQAVVAELVRLGVSADSIRPAAFGETRPLVPTPDRVQDPQNRRVELHLLEEPEGQTSRP